MKYVKACDILPKYLLEEIQNYAEGCIIYIPNKTGNRRAWGDMTSAKKNLLYEISRLKKTLRLVL